eukprot:scaffold16062_cov81-Phaeocystis_antarctica.AAC.1
MPYLSRITPLAVLVARARRDPGAGRHGSLRCGAASICSRGWLGLPMVDGRGDEHGSPAPLPDALPIDWYPVAHQRARLPAGQRGSNEDGAVNPGRLFRDESLGCAGVLIEDQGWPRQRLPADVAAGRLACVSRHRRNVPLRPSVKAGAADG